VKRGTAGAAKFFANGAAFRAWLDEHHAAQTEVLVGYYKRATGKPSMTWPESVDQALCYGWIDGVRRNAGEDAYTIRFTPRKPRSIWSAKNVARVGELTAAGLMTAPGLAAFALRTAERTGVYSFERKDAAVLSPAQEALLRANAAAAAFWDAQPPGYKATATHWVISAKQEATRASRLAELIADAAQGLRIKPLRRWESKPRRRPR
jgi:uncharacterized protein YdeI (YjbR/CyaY-like superfamily)